MSKIAQTLTRVSLNTGDAIRKVIKEYSNSYTVILSVLTGTLECYKDKELLLTCKSDISYEEFIKTDKAIEAIGIAGVVLQKIYFISV